MESQREINRTFYFSNGYFALEEDGPEFNFTVSDTFDGGVNTNLHGEEVSLSIPYYNEMFRKNLDKPTSPDFEEQDFYYVKYSNQSVKNHVVEDIIHFHVKQVHNASSVHDCIKVSQDLYDVISDWQSFQYGWAFDNTEQCYDLYLKMLPYCYYNKIDCFAAVFNTINMISIFSDVFRILFFVFILVLVLIVVMHNRRIMKKEQYRLGVYKSLGYNNLYLTLAILFINIITTVAIFGISVLFSWGIGEGANFLIQFGFYTWSKNVIYYAIRMLTFSVLNVGLFSLMVLGIMIVSTFIPLLLIRKIKPSKIIRNAE